MSVRVDPQFLTEIKKYGAVNVEKCFNCGNCTAICPLSTNERDFPAPPHPLCTTRFERTAAQQQGALAVLLLR